MDDMTHLLRRASGAIYLKARNTFVSSITRILIHPKYVHFSSQQPGFATADIIRDYGRLYRDAPRHPIKGTMPIDVRGYNDMDITVGQYHLPSKDNPVSNLWENFDLVDRSKPFYLTARFEDGIWPLDVGFRRLGEFFTVLAYEEMPYERWRELNVILPNFELPYDTSTPSHIPPDAFIGLRSLIWTGHRQQLHESWLPFTPSILRSLTTLHLTTHLALQDCANILFYSLILKDVTFDRIYKGLANDPILSFDASGLLVERPLESLTLTSDDDVGPLIMPFTFSSLHHIKFKLSYPTISTFHGLDIWKTLQTASIDCPMTEEDGDWIRNQCPSTIELEFLCNGNPLNPGLYVTSYRSKEGVHYELVLF
ncbi:hypothetical protein DXG01_005724 [Tephrocybe rancida]|nr:hypothetical protein DXG01_005724 [Tephrocybe rancida]